MPQTLTFVLPCRDFLLKTQDIDNIAKRLESYPPPADGLPVTHPAALGGPQVRRRLAASGDFADCTTSGCAGTSWHLLEHSGYCTC